MSARERLLQPNILWLDSCRPRGRRNCSPGQQQKHYPGQFHHLRLQKNWKHLPEESVSDAGVRAAAGGRWRGAGRAALATWPQAMEAGRAAGGWEDARAQLDEGPPHGAGGGAQPPSLPVGWPGPGRIWQGIW